MAFKDVKIHARDIMQAASRLEQLGYEVLQVKVTHKTDGRNWVFYSIEEALEAVA